MTTATQAAVALVQRLAAKVPPNARGTHAVWVQTTVEADDFVRTICVATNPKFKIPVDIPRQIQGWPVRRMEWPTGDDVDTIAAYEDGSRPA